MGLTAWHVDPIQSYLHGLEISALGKSRRGAKTNDRPWGVRELWAETVFVSICHATNWDSLHSAIEYALASEPDLLEPSRLSSITTTEFEQLTGLPSPEGSRDSLRRQTMLRELGREALQTRFIHFLHHVHSREIELGGEGGAYAVLAKLSAFSADPLQKKSRVLVHQWISAGSLTVPDAERIAPAVDYHLIRLYLRSNRIHPRAARTLDRFRAGKQISPRELQTMRLAVEEAMHYTAAGAQLSIADLNHYEWQIARSFCVRAGARCDGPGLKEKPVDSPVASLATEAGGCPLKHVCRGASEQRMRELIEPQSNAEFY